MDVHAYIAERLPLVDARLEGALPKASTPPVTLHGAMRHLVFPGGKRLRPMLTLAAAEALGAPPATALPAAVAVELIHTYSLVHDDLPCMDDDDERRGRPTVHVKYGEAVAVLAGDALQALAFETLIAASDGDPVQSERFAAAVLELARAAGSANLVGGQVDDLAFGVGNGDTTGGVEAIESIHRRKSAALISASVCAGAQLAGATGDTLGALRSFGLEVGIAFQIADDLLDEGDDDPCSLVGALGADACRARAEALLATAIERIEELGERAEPLRELARYAVRRRV